MAAPLALTILSGGFSCGGSTAVSFTDAATARDAGGIDRTRLDAPLHLGGPCDAVEDTPPLQPGVHVAIGSDITTWDSNPPSSGEHYPIWAAYQAYSTPVPRGYYVHDLEHGAIDLLYNCAIGDAGQEVTLDASGGDDGDGGDAGAGPCPTVAAQLQAIIDAFPSDPKCDPTMGQPRVRFVLTPDPLLDVPVAAAAWGWTYKASCVDSATLSQFAKDHYDQGTEELCANGQSFF
ncbi:MAG: DUF3105 domain-containing protein [Polyangiaceae bacterium]